MEVHGSLLQAIFAHSRQLERGRIDGFHEIRDGPIAIEENSSFAVGCSYLPGRGRAQVQGGKAQGNVNCKEDGCRWQLVKPVVRKIAQGQRHSSYESSRQLDRAIAPVGA